jgi:hypothetical protein
MVDEKAVSFKCYPNPNNGQFTVETDLENATIEIVSAFGQLIQTTPVSTGKTLIDLSEYQSGVYIVRLKDIKLDVVNMTRVILTK